MFYSLQNYKKDNSPKMVKCSVNQTIKNIRIDCSFLNK